MNHSGGWKYCAAAFCATCGAAAIPGTHQQKAFQVVALLVRRSVDRSGPRNDSLSYNIATLDIINGALPRRAHALVVEWASLHKDELMKNWDEYLLTIKNDSQEPIEIQRIEMLPSP